MKIAVDVMSGEKGPDVLIKGALDAAIEFNDSVILVGNAEIIRSALSKHIYPKEKVEIVHSSQVITMNDKPTTALKEKPDASVVVCARLVKRGIADGFVSPGNTGATFAAAFINLGRLKGVSRPAILAIVPTETGKYTAIIDVGANPQCKPIHLVQFAVMGEIYSRYVLGVEKPRIGILSNGEEELKGIELTQKTYEILSKLPLNFVGYIEGRDLFNNRVDVAVCDGFVGNIVLKTIEGVGLTMYNILKQGIKERALYKFGALLMYNVFKRVKKKIDYAEYGGAPLLGLNGVCIVTHGSSSSKEIKNGIKVAKIYIKNNINNIIIEKLKEYKVNKFSWMI